MPWVTLTADDVKARMTSREVEVYEEIAASEYPEGGGEAEVPVDAAERMPIIVDQVCNRFRGAIRSNPRVAAMGPAGTLPDFCIFDAAVIARNALIGLPPVPEGMTDPRTKELSAAEKTLESLRSIDPKAFADDPPVSESTGSASFGGIPYVEF